MEQVKKEMEKLRAELNKLTAEENYYNSEAVLKVSKELDKIISMYVKVK